MPTVEPGAPPPRRRTAPERDEKGLDVPPSTTAREAAYGSTIARTVLIGALVPAVFAGAYHLGPVAREAYRTLVPTQHYTTGDFADLLEATGTQVVMFATGDCRYCEMARVLFAQEQVVYTELRIDKSEQADAEFAERGGRGVPLLYIGDRRIAGYRELAIREALERLQRAEGVGLDLQRSP